MMFKKIFLITALMISMGSASAADLKVGIVNVQKILSKSPQVKTINEKIQKQFKARYEELETMRKKGAKLQEKMQRDGMTLTMAQKLEISREVQTLDGKFKLKQTFLQDDISIASKQEQAKLMRKIQKAIAEVAKKEKVDLVLKSEAIAYLGSSIDLSDKVIAAISNPAG